MAFCKQCGANLEDDARFCEKCGTPIASQNNDNNTAMMQPESNVRKQNYEGEIRKCPNCGDPIDAFEFICDKCGFNFSTNRMSTSQEKLSAQLAVIDAKMQEAKKRNNKRGYNEWAIPFKEQKATCINTFPVANSVEEIVSFLMYASGNIDMTCISTSNLNVTYDKGDHMIADAWIGKMDQMYQMAKISFSDSPMFAQIEQIYTSKKNEIKKTGVKRILSSPFLLVGVAIVIFIGMYIESSISLDRAVEKEEEERIKYEAMGYISAGYAGNYEKENYEVVKKKFEDMGFVNIELIDLEDAGGRNKENTVDSVSIKGNSNFGYRDYFSPEDRVVISYH